MALWNENGGAESLSQCEGPASEYAETGRDMKREILIYV